MAKVRCTNRKCKSSNCTPVATDKSYKVGKGLVNGAVGTMLLGPIGLAVGLASGANGKKKVKFVCNDCGTIFEVKI